MLPGSLPNRSKWDNLPQHDKMVALYVAICDVWESMVLTDQDLASRVERVRQQTTDDLGKLSRRIKELEDRLESKDLD
jgi:hypothetical protein